MQNVEMTMRIHKLEELRKQQYELDDKGQVIVDKTTGAQKTKEVVTGDVARADLIINDVKVGDVAFTLNLLTEEEQEFFQTAFKKNVPVRIGA